jgi:hypothetical protein
VATGCPSVFALVSPVPLLNQPPREAAALEPSAGESRAQPLPDRLSRRDALFRELPLETPSWHGRKPGAASAGGGPSKPDPKWWPTGGPLFGEQIGRREPRVCVGSW